MRSLFNAARNNGLKKVYVHVDMDKKQPGAPVQDKIEEFYWSRAIFYPLS